MKAPSWLTDFTAWWWSKVKPPEPGFTPYDGPAIPPYVGGYPTGAVTGQPATWRIGEDRIMREAPPEVMAKFSEEELTADVPLSKAKKAKQRQPAKARKVLAKLKARKKAHKAKV